MSFFTAEEAAALAESTVRLGTLVDLEFDDDPKYVWNGNRQIKVAGSPERTYDGFGAIGSIEGLGYSGDAASKQITLTLSGTKDVPLDNSVLAIALNETDKVEGRLAIISLQLFDEAWQQVGLPFEPAFGIMQRPKVTRSPMTLEEGGQQLIQLPVENLFFGRSRPAAGRFTDRDQQTRFPGDRFFAWVASLVSKTVTFPDY